MFYRPQQGPEHRGFGFSGEPGVWLRTV